MHVAPYGTWQSEITAELIASKTITFTNIVADQTDIYCAEMRPNENGRIAIVKYTADGQKHTVLPEGYSARTRVHEYGGQAFTVHQQTIYFVNYADQNLYKIQANQAPQQITKHNIRFAELKMTEHGLLAVAERHTIDTAQVENFLALVDPDTGVVQELATGFDFYAAPTLSPNNKLAWICWNHPNMPWNNNQLWVADLVDGRLINQQQLLKSELQQAFFQPQWDRNGDLYYVSDLHNWWNLYKWQVTTDRHTQLCNLAAEFAQPLWQLGTACWQFYQDYLICIYTQAGSKKLAILDPSKTSNNLDDLALPFSEFSNICVSHNNAYFIGGSPTQLPVLAKLALDTKDAKQLQILSTSSDLNFAPDSLSMATHITFPTLHNRQPLAYAFYYPPFNKNYMAPADTKPPLMIIVHGGPTAATNGSLKLAIQYWTSRGFAVADINYCGSTGYGREYRLSLERDSADNSGYWGDIDIKDCIACVQYLSNNNLINPNKVVIRGGSAGGYTTLASLAFTDVYTAGTSYYGVSDIMALARDTHKFEARYMDRLVGSLPEFAAVYDARSPAQHLEKFRAQLLVLQGDEDKIVPPNQAEYMVEALRVRGLRVEYKLYQGEQHGFRQAATIIDSLQRELEFYLSVFYG